MYHNKIFLILPVIAVWVLTDNLFGQEVLYGRVIDSETGEPLAFVNIVYDDHGKGITSGIDGYFHLETDRMPVFLSLSYVGYEPLTRYLSPDDFGGLLIRMKRKTFSIDEVTVTPGNNPAHRIIRLALGNRNINDPEKLSSFSYEAYNKLYFTYLNDTVFSMVNLPGSSALSTLSALSGSAAHYHPAGAGYDHSVGPGSEFSGSTSCDNMHHTKEGSLKEEIAGPDEVRIRRLIEKQHLFLMETITSREYRRPGRNNERVVASRVSGFKDPSFSLLATQLQSFSFYDDFISLLDRRYLNPISRGSFSRYSFVLENSLPTGSNDTLFIISFRPYPGRNFDGLRGVVYINSNRYALQNVIAETYEPQGLFTLRIRQKYSFIDGREWFPTELYTDIIAGSEREFPGSDTRYVLVGKGKSYLSDIEIDPDLSGKRFSRVELAILPDAQKRDEQFWEESRAFPLSEKDEKTYHIIDSIGEASNFDRTLSVFEALYSGYIPWGFINIDYTTLLDYNYFEGLRPGLRLLTNERLSERFHVGGKIAWGFEDKVVKYGAEAGVMLYRPGDAILGISYRNDLQEAGSFRFLGTGSPFSSENYRRFVIGRMDYIEDYTLSASFRMLPNFTGRFYFSLTDVSAGDDYVFTGMDEGQSSFRFSESGFQIRFAHGERFMETFRGSRISMGNSYPLLWLNYGRGSRFMDGGYDYTRVEAGVLHSFFTKNLGKTSVMVECGIVSDDVPYQRLYGGKGSFRNFSVEAASSFATMRMPEFISDRFISLFFKQNFESLIFRRGNFRPGIVFATNIGAGSLSRPENHINTPFKTMEKGYFESGLLINDIFRQLFVGYGFGIFYRYGPYSFNKIADNFAFKLTLDVNLR